MVKNIFTFSLEMQKLFAPSPNTCEMVKELRLIVPDCYEFHVDDLMRNASGKIDSEDEFVQVTKTKPDSFIPLLMIREEG